MPVRLELFEKLEKYAADLAAGEIDLTKPPRNMGPVVVFCVNFYVQFFENALGAQFVSVDDRARKVAVRVRLQLKKEKAPRETILMATWFERFCEIYPNVLALRYGLQPSKYVDFLETYVLELLRRTAAWAEHASEDGLQATAEEILVSLEKALRSLRSD